VFKVGGRHRLSDQVALYLADAERFDEVALAQGLDALGNGGQPECLRDGGNGAHDGAVGPGIGDLGYEGAVDLDGVERKAEQILERGVADAEIVDGNPETGFAQATQQVDRVLGVLHRQAFGDLEFDEFGAGARMFAGTGDDVEQRRVEKLAC